MEVTEWFITIGGIVAVLLSGRLAYVALAARDAEAEMLIEGRLRNLKQLEGKKVQVWATDLQVVIDYLYRDERNDFIATEPHERDNHIFHSIRRLMECLD